MPLEEFYPAEKYHQDFYENNPNYPYSRAIIRPKLEKFEKSGKVGLSGNELAKARGKSNPRNRFERLAIELEDEFAEEARNPQTQFLRDDTQTLISYTDSPDIGFRASLNPYRGCEHGCAYCYARPYHEYLGFSAGLDFETRIMVKLSAPEILRRELSSPKWQPQVVAMSGVTDCYQPIERKLQITRRCLEVLG